MLADVVTVLTLCAVLFLADVLLSDRRVPDGKVPPNFVGSVRVAGRRYVGFHVMRVGAWLWFEN